MNKENGYNSGYTTGYADGLRIGYEQGRADAFCEIAYSDCVNKEPFEILAYIRGARDFAEWLSRKHGINTCAGLINGNLAYKELDVDEVLKQWEKQGVKVEEQKGGAE